MLCERNDCVVLRDRMMQCSCGLTFVARDTDSLREIRPSLRRSHHVGYTATAQTLKTVRDTVQLTVCGWCAKTTVAAVRIDRESSVKYTVSLCTVGMHGRRASDEAVSISERSSWPAVVVILYRILEPQRSPASYLYIALCHFKYKM